MNSKWIASWNGLCDDNGLRHFGIQDSALKWLSCEVQQWWEQLNIKMQTISMDSSKKEKD